MHVSKHVGWTRVVAVEAGQNELHKRIETDGGSKHANLASRKTNPFPS